MTTPNGSPAHLPTDRHWCTVEAEKLPEVIKGQCDRYVERLRNRGLLALWKQADRAYYGCGDDGGWNTSAAVSFKGESDELVVPRLNHVRSLAQAILATATAQKPEFQAQAKSDDTQSLIEAPIATGVIRAFWREKRMSLLMRRDGERAILYGEGYMHLRWSVHAGKPVMQPAPMPPAMPGAPPPKPQMVQATDPNGVPMREGDVIPASCSPVSVIHELDSQGQNLDWAIVAHREDAYELAACYPKFERELRDAIGRPRWPERVWIAESVLDVPPQGDTRITVWCLYHKPTMAVPQGRYAIVAADRVLYDGPALLKDEVPVYPIIPMLHLDTGEGHSALWDILNIQELFDAGASSIATGQDAYGLRPILTPEGSNVGPEQIAGGIRCVPYVPGPNGEKPESLSVQPNDPSAFEYQDWLQKQAETISGVNSTARGNPDSQVKSGSFAALMDSKATHFQSATQEAVVDHDQVVAGGYIKILKAVGGISRVAEVDGRSGSRLKTVSVDEIEQIDRVIVEQVDPSMTQPGVRWELVQSMMKGGLLTSPQQAVRIFTTGKVEPLFKAPEAELDLINQENDLLSEGQLPAVCFMQPPKPPMPGMPPGPQEETPRTCHPGDEHALHIREHKALLDLATRRDPRKRQAIEKHLADHTAVAMDIPPQVAALTGQSVPVAAAPAPPGEPGSPDGPKPGPGGLKKPEPAGSAPRAKPGGGPGGPDQPLMPQNPATGERAPA